MWHTAIHLRSCSLSLRVRDAPQCADRGAPCRHFAPPHCAVQSLAHTQHTAPRWQKNTCWGHLLVLHSQTACCPPASRPPPATAWPGTGPSPLPAAWLACLCALTSRAVNAGRRDGGRTLARTLPPSDEVCDTADYAYLISMHSRSAFLSFCSRAGGGRGGLPKTTKTNTPSPTLIKHDAQLCALLFYCECTFISKLVCADTQQLAIPNKQQTRHGIVVGIQPPRLASERGCYCWRVQQQQAKGDKASVTARRLCQRR